MGIHALAHMWGFEEARKASRAFLVDMEDSIAKVELATRYDYDDWMRKAYEELAKRPDPLSIEEARRICQDLTIIFSLFFSFPHRPSAIGHRPTILLD